jgi:hypothetical protein
MCIAYDCYQEDCRINHVRRANVAHSLEGSDERASQLSELIEEDEDEDEEMPMDRLAVAEGGERPADPMETETERESQFELLFSAIMQERRDATR